MAERRRSRWQALGLIAVGCAASLLCGGGCKSTSGGQGKDQAVSAGYAFGSLTCDLGVEVTTDQVAAAAEEALRVRGYTVTSRRVSSDRARVVGKAAGEWSAKQTVVESSLTAQGNRVRVKAEPFGDESASRAILDEMLAMMGQ